MRNLPSNRYRNSYIFNGKRSSQSNGPYKGYLFISLFLIDVPMSVVTNVPLFCNLCGNHNSSSHDHFSKYHVGVLPHGMSTTYLLRHSLYGQRFHVNVLLSSQVMTHVSSRVCVSFCTFTIRMYSVAKFLSFKGVNATLLLRYKPCRHPPSIK